MKNVEIPRWLERLPLAPEFHPTDTEFADPIAYISKIEEEASAFGMCKIVPPFPKPSRKYVLHNLNKSLSKCPELGSDANLAVLSKKESGARENCDRTVNKVESRAVFTTRHQELGFEKGKRAKGTVGDVAFAAQKQVWQSGEVYTLEQFEAKSKNFAKSYLGMVKDANPLVIEAMFWKSSSEKPIYVEYANDVPGSGFSEPEGLLPYFHRCRRRRRKRNSFDRNCLQNTDSKNAQVDRLNIIRDNKDSEGESSAKFCTETSNHHPSGQSHYSASLSGGKESQGGGDVEGTSGWKLSNSPWNLQVIARSPGSLTRFMPDDIPGVTSPMVYIGMLFSWFAWHVEDHELHSLNFLHVGSPKTWYAVPGDYAFNFEEAIRRHAYGGTADGLAALSLLGEKTTILSPEVIVSSGIPCCRLVQNPGEFVVTFPRAYHIGFSHGFNCGEAANFGTPKWLAIAKDAAVRRSAMNYLPMLSHQQLLYLLTMSFISRIPRSLLPGVRSSRLRDRQKEERELSVKKAFIEDISHENRLLTDLLKRNSTYHAILWDVESLPSSSKESEICKDTDASMLALTDKGCTDNSYNEDDLSDLSMYIGAVGFDLNDDDLAYDFQMESGTLPCIACGILGFPFMAVVQPSEAAAIELLLIERLTTLAESGTLYNVTHVAVPSTEGSVDKAKLNQALHDESGASSVAETSQPADSFMMQSPIPRQPSLMKHKAVSSVVRISNEWNNSNSSLRPRVFCLEHAIEIEKLLSSKGGANVLVICHSDFQKIKTHAAVIAEEVGIPYCYTEIPLGDASFEDLNVVDIAIDRDEQVASAEDWTSKLNINLHHCVKGKKSTQAKKLPHLLGLAAFFGDAAPSSNASKIKWQSRKVRSMRRSKHSKNKPFDGNEIMECMNTNKEHQKVEEDVKTSKEHQLAKEDVKIIQYSRKKYKARPRAEALAPILTSSLVSDILTTDPDNLDNEDRNRAGTVSGTVNDGKSFSGQSMVASDGMLELQCEHVHPSRRDTNLETSATALIPVVEAQAINCAADEVIISDQVVGSFQDSHVNDIGLEKNEGNFMETVGSTANEDRVAGAAENESSREEDMMYDSAVVCDQLAENDCELPLGSDGDELIKEASRLGGSSTCSDDGTTERCDEQMEGGSVVSKSLSCEDNRHVPIDTDSQEKVVLGDTGLINESTSTLTEENLLGDAPAPVESHNDDDKNDILLEEKVSGDCNSSMAHSKPVAKKESKRKREVSSLELDDHFHGSGFIRSPCEGLRSRARDYSSSSVPDSKTPIKETPTTKKSRKFTDHSIPCKGKKEHKKGSYKCDLDGCTMSFQTKAELLLHKANRCPVEGCRKKFNSHKYAIQHQRVHDDDRPLKCPWNGCTMSFKWAWARTEHLRVHTGERPYACKVEGCGLTFRFVSDFSRHRRKTGHYVSPPT